MHLKMSLVSVVILALTPWPVRALDCQNVEIQSEINQCAAQAWELADEDLNLAYGMARDAAKQMDSYGLESQPSAEIMLRDAQRAWIQFRDLACDTESMLAYGGTMQPALYYFCMERLTRTRTEDLRYFGEVN